MKNQYIWVKEKKCDVCLCIQKLVCDFKKFKICVFCIDEASAQGELEVLSESDGSFYPDEDEEDEGARLEYY
jgi:hypothetical protein